MNDSYDYFWTVHSFDVKTFEFSVPAEIVLMTWSVYKIFLSSEYGNSFYWGPQKQEDNFFYSKPALEPSQNKKGQQIF